MYVCEICDAEFDKWQQKANHVRWKHKSDDFYEKSDNNKMNSLMAHFDRKLGVLKKFDVVCETCGVKFEVEERSKQFPKKEKYFCSRSCANKYSSTINKEQKNINISKGINEFWDNKGRTLNKYICKNCDIEFQDKNKNRIFCSMKCKREYDRKQMTNKRIYKSLTKFKFSLNEFPDKFNFDLIKQHGWYKAKNHGDNLAGVSRDHMYSVNEGFKNNVPPYYISHPANCKLLIHSENFKKLDKCSITLDELIQRINYWNENI